MKARKPAGYLLVVDGETVWQAGKDGVIKRLEDAKRLAEAMQSARPESSVEVLGVFPVAS